VDVCCGNGRDSYFFAGRGLCVTAIDHSRDAITAALESINQSSGTLAFEVLDARWAAHHYAATDCVYCRWGLHAMTGREHMEWLAAVSGMPCDACLAIEARAVAIDHGRHVEHEGDHYRRLISPKLLVHELTEDGFEVTTLRVSRGLSVQNGDDPLLLRVIASRR
jgi:SAM-dependent methyltransferase